MQRFNHAITVLFGYRFEILNKAKEGKELRGSERRTGFVEVRKWGFCNVELSKKNEKKSGCENVLTIGKDYEILTKFKSKISTALRIGND